MTNLIGMFMADFARLEPGERIPDGQGGYAVQWREAGRLRAALTAKRSAQGVSAEKRTVSEVYNVTTDVGAHLTSGDVLRRLSDGATFRVTSNYTYTSPPKCAGFSFERVTAERWDLP